MEEKQILAPKMLAADAALILNTSIQNIHKKIKDGGFHAEKSQNRVYFGHSIARQIFRFQFEPKIYSFQLVKGGVGKTAVSFNFAVGCSLLGAKVALIELDQQANLTRTFGLDAEKLKKAPVMIDVINQNLNLQDCLITVSEGIDLLPSRVDNALLDNTLLLGKHPLDKVLSSPLNKLKKSYDVIIIDCPPSISASVAAAALASDVIVMPVNPTDYSIAGLDLTYREINELFQKYDKKAELKILFNKYDGRTSSSFNIMRDLTKHQIYGDLLIGSYVRAAQSIENYIAQGKSVFDSIKNSNEKEDFFMVTRLLLGIPNG